MVSEQLPHGKSRSLSLSLLLALSLVAVTPLASATTTPSAPRSPQAATGINTITLTWQAPSSDGGSAITNYAVYRGTGGGKSLVTTGGCANLGNVLTCEDDGCTALANCYYQVRARNSVGLGTYSGEAVATVLTPGLLPQCMDGLDNDHDGRADFVPAILGGGGDAECTNPLDPHEGS